MSSNRDQPIFRAMLALCLAASVAGCASTGGKTKTAKTEALTPTEQFAIKVTSHPDEIMLAPHADGLSQRQADAVADLVDRWRDLGDETITIQSPSAGGGEVYRATTAVQHALLGLGVLPDQIHLTGYDAAARPGAPIVVGFERYEAKGPQCGRSSKSYTQTTSNRPTENFGCAVTANAAAMIANPADLVHPRTMDEADAARRETVLSKYRNGQVTSSAKDEQAAGTVSTAVQ
jgi:pilus assembly protein CpaD